MTPTVAARRLRILELLASGMDGATIRELADTLDVSAASVRRDLGYMDERNLIVVAQDDGMRLHACLVVREGPGAPPARLTKPLGPLPMPGRLGIPPRIFDAEFVERAAAAFASSVASGDWRRAEALASLVLPRADADA
jgi:DNA-binding transcriptional ArsR family regulator